MFDYLGDDFRYGEVFLGENKMAKKNETIEIPMNLARLIVAEKEDFRDDGVQYDDAQKLAKSMLKVLMLANK